MEITMRIKLDFDDESAAFEVMNIMFVAYMKNERKQYKKWKKDKTMVYDEEFDKIVEAMDVLIDYYGGYDEIQDN